MTDKREVNCAHCGILFKTEAPLEFKNVYCPKSECGTAFGKAEQEAIKEYEAEREKNRQIIDTLKGE